MPRDRTAYKELRKAKKRHIKNISTKSELKTIAKSYEKLISTKDLEAAKKALPGLVSKLNRAATKGILKKNTAARRISRLMKKISATTKAKK